MSVYKKPGSEFYLYDFVHDGVRHYGSTDCAIEKDAREFEEALKRVAKGRADSERKLRSKQDRQVYILRARGSGLLKIGSAIDVSRRHTMLQCGSPEILMLIWSGPGGSRGEAMLHRALWSFRSHGEWFRPAPQVLQMIDMVWEHGIDYAVPTWLREHDSLARQGPDLA